MEKPKQLTDNGQARGTPPACRSAVTNQTRLHVKGDGRGASARRWKDLFRAFLAESKGRGMANETLARQAATLETTRETLDAQAAQGEAIDPEVLLRLSHGLGRTLSALGLVTWLDGPPPPKIGPKPPDLTKLRDPSTWKAKEVSTNTKEIPHEHT